MSDDKSVDDRSILDHHRLFRRVKPTQVVPRDDGTLRLTSDVFKQPEMSVYLEPLLIEYDLAPETVLEGHPGFFLTAITAGNVREFDHPIVKDPEPHPAHGLVLGKKRDRFANAMARNHQWVVPPPPGYTPPEGDAD